MPYVVWGYSKLFMRNIILIITICYLFHSSIHILTLSYYTL